MCLACAVSKQPFSLRAQGYAYNCITFAIPLVFKPSTSCQQRQTGLVFPRRWGGRSAGHPGDCSGSGPRSSGRYVSVGRNVAKEQAGWHERANFGLVWLVLGPDLEEQAASACQGPICPTRSHIHPHYLFPHQLGSTIDSIRSSALHPIK